MANQKISEQSHSLNEFLQCAGKLIQEEMMEVIPNGEPKEYLYNLMQDYPSRGGKRFRSSLLILIAELFGASAKEALFSAVALELFQNFALIHDDIEDHSLMRRGQPTLHRLHGIPLSINAGDRLFGLVYEVLLKNRAILGEKKTFQILDLFNQVFTKTFEGQAMDIGWVTQKVFPSKTEYEQMITRKTGWYSGKGPCECGALIAGATLEQQVKVGEFGLAIGIGFQIRDDVLNLITESTEVAPRSHAGGYGKERGGDIAEGKRTLITIVLAERLQERSLQQKLHTILSKPREKVTEEEVIWCIEMAEKTGAIDATMQRCNALKEQAKQSLIALPDQPGKKLLAELVDYLTIERVS